MLAAPFILRLTLGSIFILFGHAKLFKNRAAKIEFFEKIHFRPGNTYATLFGSLEMLIGILLVLGLYTQFASLLAVLILIGAIIIKCRRPELLPGETMLFTALLAIAVSLLFSGAGFLAFDLRL